MCRFPVPLARPLVPLAVLFLAGCSGGGGGGSSDSQPPPDVPTTLDFALSPQWFDTSPGLLRTSFAGSRAGAGAFTTLRAEGTYNRDTQATTLKSLQLEVVLDPDPLAGSGTLTLGFLMPDPLSWTAMGAPNAGTFQFGVSGGSYDFDRVNMAVTTPQDVTIQAFLGVDGVHGPVQLTWGQLDALADDAGAPAWQQVALLGYQTWQFLFKQASLAYTSLETVVTQDAALQAQGTVTRTGTDFPARPGATLQATWQDISPGGELGVGDSFRMGLTHWWVDWPSDDVDDLYEGALQLTGYTEMERTIGGDFEFQGLTSQETESGALADTITTVNGGFNFTLSW